MYDHNYYVLKAAGFDVLSWEGNLAEETSINVRAGAHGVIHKIRGGWVAVPAWLSEQRIRYPSAEAILIEKLDHRLKGLQRDLDAVRVVQFSHQAALCDALAGKVGEPVLCYTGPGEAWFTSDLEQQWGDDWNDAPLSCNAGNPYDYSGQERRPYLLVKVLWTGLWSPCEESLGKSVQAVNSARGAWLLNSRDEEIVAGTPLSVFRAKIVASGGTVSWPQFKDG